MFYMGHHWHGINFEKKTQNTQMYRCAAVGVCILVVSGAPMNAKEKEKQKKSKRRTIPTLWGVVYQTHLQCNEHTVEKRKIGREC